MRGPHFVLELARGRARLSTLTIAPAPTECSSSDVHPALTFPVFTFARVSRRGQSVLTFDARRRACAALSRLRLPFPDTHFRAAHLASFVVAGTSRHRRSRTNHVHRGRTLTLARAHEYLATSMRTSVACRLSTLILRARSSPHLAMRFGCVHQPRLITSRPLRRRSPLTRSRRFTRAVGSQLRAG